MARRTVGLDLGTNAVRAAEVRLGPTPQLRGFGQVALPRSAVQRGEVVEPGAVADALKRLWRESRIRDRRVRVGLASLRTIVRQVDMPEMEPDELRGAIEFQAADFIPLPIEDTYIDFRILEHFTDAEGGSRMQVLLAAAHRDVVDSALTAVETAGLQPVAVDLVPFALVRSLGATTAPPGAADPGGADEGDSGAEPAEPPGMVEGLVSVGGGVTVVVVHEFGVPRFVRIVDTGGNDLTEAVADALGVEFEEAEAIKRGLADAPGAQRADVEAAVEGPLTGLLNEIRGSVEFYVSQAGARPLDRLLVTGGGALLQGFVERLDAQVDVPVEYAGALDRIEVGDIGFEPHELERLQPFSAVPIGLALGGAADAPAQVNLLPAGVRRAYPASRLVLVGLGTAAVLAALLGALTMQRNAELDDEREALANQQAVNQQLQTQIAALQGAQDLQVESDEAQARVAAVLGTDVSWSRLLQEVARVIPGDVWLNSFNGNVAAGTGVISGSTSFTATGSDFPSAAAWLQRLSSLPSLDTPWVSEVSRGETSIRFFENLPTVGFTSTASITDEARSERSRQARDEAGVTEPPAAPPPEAAS